MRTELASYSNKILHLLSCINQDEILNLSADTLSLRGDGKSAEGESASDGGEGESR